MGLFLLNEAEVTVSVRQHLENKGYSVSHSLGQFGISQEIFATRDKDTFLIEAIGETSESGEENIIFALGKIVKRMKTQDFWVNYGIAMPRRYFKLLKDFEIFGFKTLNLHVFLVESIPYLIHLTPKETTDLMQQLKEGKIVNPDSITF